MGLVIFIYIIILAVVLVINHYIANQFYNNAVLKGHNERKYYWICFLLGLVGYLLVISLPDLLARPMRESRPFNNYETIDDEEKQTEKKEEVVKETSNLLDIFKTDN